MALNAKAVSEQLATTTRGAEALVVKLKELHLRIEMLRNTRQVSSDTAGLLDSLVNSAYVNAANLRTSLEPISGPLNQAEESPAEGKPSDEQSEGLSCQRCGRDIKDGYKLCPYCGFDLKPKACDACGHEVLAEFRFCPTCGKRFG